MIRSPRTISPPESGAQVIRGSPSGRATSVRARRSSEFVTFADADHTAALQAWLDASADGTPLHLDAGEYKTSGSLFSLSRTKSLTITGDGSDVVTIKRLDGSLTDEEAVSGGDNHVFAIGNASGHQIRVTLSGFTVDHNEQNNPLPEGAEEFDWQFCSAVYMASTGARGIASFDGDDLKCLNPVADFLSFTGSGTWGRMTVRNMYVPVRARARFDITVVKSYDLITVLDSDITTMRFEQVATDYTQNHDLLMERVTVRDPEWKSKNFVTNVGDVVATAYGSFDRKPQQVLRNCTIEGQYEFGGADLLVVDSSITVRRWYRVLSGNPTFERVAFSAPDAVYTNGVIFSANNVPMGRSTYRDCTFTTNAESGLWFWFYDPATVDGGLTLDGCTVTGDLTFELRKGHHSFIDTAFTGSPPDGVYVKVVGAADLPDTSLTFTNCTFAEPTAPWAVPTGVPVTAA